VIRCKAYSKHSLVKYFSVRFFYLLLLSLSPFAISAMATVYAVAPRPASSLPSVSSYMHRHSSHAHHTQRHTAQAGPSTSLSTLKKNNSLISSSSITNASASKRKRNESPDDHSADSASPQPSRKPRDGPKKKKANRACYHCQKAHLTCDDCEFIMPLGGRTSLIFMPCYF